MIFFQIEDTVQQMLTTNCHPDLLNRPTAAKYFKTFESNATEERGNRNAVLHGGSISSKDVAFCGRNMLSFGEAPEVALYDDEEWQRSDLLGGASRQQVCVFLPSLFQKLILGLFLFCFEDILKTMKITLVAYFIEGKIHFSQDTSCVEKNCLSRCSSALLSKAQ